MAFDAHKNFAYSTVATAPSPALSGTSLIVATGDGAKFPAPPFNLVVWPVSVQPSTTNAEILRVTAVATDTFTIVRAQEGSSARTIMVGDQADNAITLKWFTDAEYMTLINRTTVAGAAVNNITVTIPAGYQDLFITFMLRGTFAGAQAECMVQFNGDTANNYSTVVIYSYGSYATSQANSQGMVRNYYIPANTALAGLYGWGSMTMIQYANTAMIKGIRIEWNEIEDPAFGTNNTQLVGSTVGHWNSTAAITSILFSPWTGNGQFAIGSIISVYGRN